MATSIKFQVSSEATLASNTEAVKAGVMTFTEKAIYLGIGGKKVQYGVKQTGSSGQTVTDALVYIGSLASDDLALAEGKENALFYNSTEGALKVITDLNSTPETILTGGVSVRDLESLKTQLNAKAEKTNVYTKTEVYNKTEADKIAQDAKTEVETIVSKAVATEKLRAEAKETELKTEIDNKTKAVYYQKGIALKVNDFVIYANKIYLVTKAFTTGDDFSTDKENLFSLADSMSSSFSLVEYVNNSGTQIHSGQQVLYADKLYVCKKDIASSTTWDVDSVNMVDLGSSIDLSDYYNKSAVDSLLNQKMDILTQGEGVNVTKLDNTITVSADMSKEATASKIAQRDESGALYANMPNVLSDTAVVNYKTFKETEQRIVENTANIAVIQRKLDGTINAYFKFPKQTLIIGGENVNKSFEYETNIPIEDLIVTNWSKSDKILVNLTNKTFNSILSPVEADYPITCEITYLNQVLVKLTFNYKEEGSISSTSDYSLKGFKTYTLMEDMSKLETNPTGAYTLMDDAVGKSMNEIMEFLGITPMILSTTGEEKFKLDPNDYGKQSNGSSADRPLGNDTMVKFPIRGVKRWTNGSLRYMSITDDPNAEERGYQYKAFYKGAKKGTSFFVGAYEAYHLNGKLYSYNSVAPTVNTTLTNFRKYAQARGVGYQLIDGYMIDYIQCCYLLVHQSADSQTNVGKGICSGGVKNTGLADTFGMNNENSTDKTSTTTAIKCLGIENLWGNLWTWVDGMYLDNVYQIKKSMYQENYNDNGYGYEICGIGIRYGDGGVGYVSNVAWNDDLGFYPTSVQGGSDSKFYCDNLWQRTNKCAIFGSCYAAGLSAGIFCWEVDCAASASYGSVGSRLAFRA